MLTQRQRQNWDVRVDLVRRFLPTEADSVRRIEDETTLAVADHLKECEVLLREMGNAMNGTEFGPYYASEETWRDWSDRIAALLS